MTFYERSTFSLSYLSNICLSVCPYDSANYYGKKKKKNTEVRRGMENSEGPIKREPQKNKEPLAYSNNLTGDQAIYAVLVDSGEPIEIESQTVYVGNNAQEELIIYSPKDKEKSQELKSIVSLLKLSPQFQVLKSAKSVGAAFSGEKVKMLNDVINAETRTLTDNEKMLFDPSYAAGFSRWPLLYTPFAVSKEVRSNIIKIARQSQRGHKLDLVDALSRSVKLGERYQERKDRGVESQKTKISVFLDRFLKRAPPIIFEKQLMEQAYDDLTNRVGGRDFLSEYQLYSPKLRDEQIRDDYMDPSLLLMEDLENRGYGIRLFRLAAPSGASKRTVDGIDDCIVALVNQKAREALDKLREPMGILNELHRGRGIAYSGYIDDFFGRRKSLYSWNGSPFTEEERKRLIAFARLKEVADEKSNFTLRKKTPEEETEKYWVKVKKEVQELNIEPADQVFLRRVISRLVDQEIPTE